MSVVEDAGMTCNASTTGMTKIDRMMFSSVLLRNSREQIIMRVRERDDVVQAYDLSLGETVPLGYGR